VAKRRAGGPVASEDMKRVSKLAFECEKGCEIDVAPIAAGRRGGDDTK
jgi:hypothetical protein